MTRLEKLHDMLDSTAAEENGIEIPTEAKRYVALEHSAFTDTLWAHFGDDLDEIKAALEESETSFVDRVRVHDLDTGATFVPVWKIANFGEIHD